MSLFWQGVGKASEVELLDKIMIGKNIDGSTKYADVNQIKLLLGAFLSGQIIPSKVEDGADLGAPSDPAVLYAPPGTYTTPSGGLELTGNLNMLFWDKTTWSALEVPVEVDLTPLVQKKSIKGKTGTNLFNKATVIPNHYLNKDNLEFENSTYCYSAPIKVEVGKTYTGKSEIGGVAPGIRYATFFDVNGVNINTGSNTHSYLVGPIPSGVDHIRITITQAGLETFMFEEGTINHLFEPYQYYLQEVNAIPVKPTYSTTELDSKLLPKASIDFVNQSIYSVFNSYPALSLFSNTAGVFLANNITSSSDGFIPKIKISAATSGNALFQVIHRRTYVYPTPVAGNKETFGAGETFTIAVTAGVKEYDVPNKVMPAGYFLAWVGKAGYVSPTFNTSILTGWWQGLAGELTAPVQLTYQVGTVGFSYTVLSDKYVTKGDPDLTVITPTRNVNDFNSIRDIMNSITDATDNNVYDILFDGMWFEFDLKGKKNVRVKGKNRDTSILMLDSTLLDAKYVAPVDFSYPDDAGKQINLISPERLNVVYPSDDIYLENLTIALKRGKYPVHLDNPFFKNATLINCVIVELSDTNYPVGIGIWGGQTITFDKCIIKRAISSGKQLGVFVHNWNNQPKASVLNVLNTKFINCGYAMIDELGSAQNDQFNFPNCQTDAIGEFAFMVGRTGNTTYWVNPATGLKEPNPQAVPYCIQLNTSGTKVDLITGRATFPAPYAGLTERPDIYDHIISDYVGYATLAIEETINKGDLISNSLANMSNQNLCQKHTGDLPILGTALETVTGVGKLIKYVPKGKYAMLNVSGAIGNGTSKKLIFDPSDDTVKVNAAADLRDIIGYSIEAKGAGRADSTCIII